MQWDRSGHLTFQLDIDDMIESFRKRTVSQRKMIPGLEPERAQVILAGAILVRSIMAATDFTEITVSEADLLEGLVLI